MTAAEWAAWNSTETDNAEAAKRIGEIIDDLAICEKSRDGWIGTCDISEHQGMAWKERAEKAERERDEWKGLAEVSGFDINLLHRAKRAEETAARFARELTEEIAHSKLAEAEVVKLKNALQALYDEQNGPPLIRHEARWQAAMDEAERLIGEGLQRELP